MQAQSAAAFQDIHYLRWARTQAMRARIPLTQSGMPPPDPRVLGAVPALDLLSGDGSDHPPLAGMLAEAWRVPREAVLVQPGSHWTVFLLLAARLDEQPGPVIVEEPAYEPLLRIAAALRAPILRLPRPRARGFTLDLEALARLGPQRPSVLVLTQPHNPSGAVLGEQEVASVAAWAQRAGCAVLSDEVYLEFLDEPERATLLHRVPGCAVVHSFTKVMGLGALRVSAAVGPLRWIARAAAVTDYGPVMLPSASQALGARAWTQRHALWKRARETAASGAAHVLAWAASLPESVELAPPGAGIVCFPCLTPPAHEAALGLARAAGVRGPFGFGLDASPGGSHEWIWALRDQRGVLLTPGAFFGDARGFRLGFGGPTAALREGLAAAAQFLREAAAAGRS
jgi:aspartate/methionine/tyrosine aminotransferase